MENQSQIPYSKPRRVLSNFKNSNFWRYWKAGIFFFIVSGVIGFIISDLVRGGIMDDFVEPFVSRQVYSLIGFVFFIAFLIVLPWLYGKIIKWIYEDVNLGQKK